jgi:hypothetical protein
MSLSFPPAHGGLELGIPTPLDQPFAASHSSQVGHHGKHLITFMTWSLGYSIPPPRLQGACVENSISAA